MAAKATPEFLAGAQAEAEARVEGLSRDARGVLATLEAMVRHPRWQDADAGTLAADLAAIYCDRSWRWRRALRYGGRC
jgi:hypothetical protein